MAAFRQGLAKPATSRARTSRSNSAGRKISYDRLPALAADLVRRQVAVIVSKRPTAMALAAKAATSTIPIVFAVGGDPGEFGLVASLNRPGGNVTGVTYFASSLPASGSSCCTSWSPATTVASFWSVQSHVETRREQRIGRRRALGRQMIVVECAHDGDIDAAFATLVNARPTRSWSASFRIFHAIAIRSWRWRRATSCPRSTLFREFAVAGGLMSYGPSFTDVYRQAGIYAGRILKGDKPADLPVQQPTKFELVINLKTAKALGLDVPRSLLARADEVIE